VLIVALIGFAAAVVLSFFCIGHLLFPVVGLVVLSGIIFPIIAGVKANEGVDFKYPYSIAFLK
jgi:uncharacterized Tic20 family protein